MADAATVEAAPAGAHGRITVLGRTSTGLSQQQDRRCGSSSASECLLFGGLISTYLLVPRSHQRAGASAPTRSSTSRSRRSARSCC